MSDKIRGIDAQLVRSTSFRVWADLAEHSAHDGTLLLFYTGGSYYLLGDDAYAAAKALQLEVVAAGVGPLLSVKREEVCAAAAKLREAGLKVVICGGGSGAPGGHWRAHVDVTMGNRRMSNFMANAGLGITGAGCKERLVFNYAPGEEVGMERVQAAMENMIAMADAEGAEFKILTFKVAKLEFIPE